MAKKEKKAKSIINKIITGISLGILLVCLVLVVYSTVSLAKNRFVRFFGYSFHIVVTDSMTPEINVGDLVIAQKTDKDNISLGDDIVFFSKDPVLRGNMVVHRVVGINEDGSFDPQGIKIGAPIDSYPASDIVGKVVSSNAFLGKAFGYIVMYRFFVFVVILLILVVVIIFEAVSINYNLKVEKAKKEITDSDKNGEGGEK